MIACCAFPTRTIMGGSTPYRSATKRRNSRECGGHLAMIAFDNETFLITRERPAPPVVCLSWYDGATSRIVHHSDVQDLVAGWLADPEQHFVGHNVAYDFATLAASYPELLPAIFDAYANGRVTDTIIRQQLFDIATGKVLADDKVRGYSLADLYRMIFDSPLPGENQKEAGGVRYRYGEFYDLPGQSRKSILDRGLYLIHWQAIEIALPGRHLQLHEIPHSKETTE